MTGSQPSPTAETAALVDTEVIRALDTLDYDPLTVLGNGELTVVVGWPADAPTQVFKPTGPLAPGEAAEFTTLFDDYLRGLDDRGIAYLDTELISLDRPDGLTMLYMVQSVLPAEELAEKALATFDPDPDNPILVGIADALAACDAEFGIDAPISNWRWDGSQVSLLDVGLPLMWNDGAPRMPADALGRAFPWIVRKPIVREIEKIFDRYQDPRVSAVEFVGRLGFFGFDEWHEPAVECLNSRLGFAEPITIDEAVAMTDLDSKTIPLLKRLQRVQRWWVRRVRRGRYEYFIADSTY